jgi:tetratricopeptide (TPR) repeat protein
VQNPGPFKYRAFLSYSHQDAAWAKWLHRALETYRVDQDLVGRSTPAGPVPKTLEPIFRDRDDFSAGSSLSEQSLAALAASQFLIVLCSPAAARSKYVNEKVRQFKALGGADRVVPVIVDGKPGDPVRECFPAMLRCKLDSEGNETNEREEPIAADLQSTADGKELAKQKVTAALLGIGLDEIVRRGERQRRRHRRIRNAFISVLAALTLASITGFAWARQELGRNEMLLDRTLARATDLVNQAVSLSEQFGVPHIVSLRMLEQAEGLFKDMSELGRDTQQLRDRKAKMLIAFARNYALLGDTKARWSRATTANQIMVALAAEAPNNLRWQTDLADSWDEVADAKVAQGKLEAALQDYGTALTIRLHVSAAAPDNAVWQAGLALEYGRIGRTQMPLGQHADTLKNFRAALGIGKRIATADPTNPKLQLMLAKLNWNLGDALRDQGKPQEALAAYRDAVSLYGQYTAKNPNAITAQHDLAWANLRIGDILRNENDFAGALRSYRGALPIFERVANFDPSNAAAQRDLGWGYSRTGDALRAQGGFDEALADYQKALAIFRRIALADPTNAVWQRELGVHYYKVGDMLKVKADFAGALENYRQSFQIAKRIAAADPNNRVWQCELARRYERLGSVYARQKKFDDALSNYGKAIAIDLRLTELNPHNLNWLEQLSYFYEWAGDVLREQGRTAEAVADYRAGLELAGQLAVDPTRAYRQRELAAKYGAPTAAPVIPVDDPPGYNRAFMCGTPRPAGR